VEDVPRRRFAASRIASSRLRLRLVTSRAGALSPSPHQPPVLCASPLLLGFNPEGRRRGTELAVGYGSGTKSFLVLLLRRAKPKDVFLARLT
jgi:hypothetical protein